MGNKWNLDGVRVDEDNNMTIGGDLTVTGDIKPGGGSQTYIVTAAVTPLRTFNPATADLGDLMDFVATLAKDIVG